LRLDFEYYCILESASFASLADRLKIDYRAVNSQLFEAITAPEFIAMVSSEHFLGNPRVRTQHFIGASRWEQTSSDEITGHHQMRVAHQKYADDALQEVLLKGHGHGGATIQFLRVDGVWKFAGLVPDIRWGEYDLDKVFAPPPKD
jgi:scytalone dehydratase